MIIGIDPGASGAIAWLADTGELIEVCDLPIAEVKVGKSTRRRLMPAVLANMMARHRHETTMAMLEEVASRPGEGAVGAFAFGRGYGQIEGVLAGCRIACTLIRPQVWKKGLNVPADKDSARLMASRQWPGAAGMFARKKDDGRAEAALIGLYAAKMLKVAP